MNGPAGRLAIPFTEADEAEPGDGPRARIKKAAGAFRTISEVADELHIPQHVLRFWETKFPQVKPLKRGGGRRYYRPDDITLLRRISDLLYIQGYTIKGVQRLLREGGGRLSDDIPPATPDERAAAQSEGQAGPAARATDDEPQLPMPGLTAPGLPSGAAPRAARPAQRPPMAQGASGAPHPADGETDRLRALLAHTLRELEALRALLA